MKYKRRPKGRDGLIADLRAEEIIGIYRRNENSNELVKDAYIELFRKYNGNISYVIKDLEVSRQSVYNDIKRFDIEDKVKKFRKESKTKNRKSISRILAEGLI